MDARTMRSRFVAGLARGLGIVWPILSALLGTMIALGLAIGWIEGWPLQDALYFTFVSGLTIGYGDLVPHRLATRALAIAIGVCGVLVTALVAAIAVKALAFAQDGDKD